MKKPIFKALVWAILWGSAQHVEAGEVLGHISEDSEPVSPAAPAEPLDDRRIIYRVICTPGGEVLPDCEQPVHDTEALAKPTQQQQDEAAEAETAEQAQPVEETAQPAKTKKPKKAVSKKKKSSKEAKKTTSSKKTAAKKK